MEGARTNLTAAGWADRSRVVLQDALSMANVYPTHAMDAIVSNPPFGLKLGPHIDFYRFYGRLLAQADRVLKPDGRMALWIHRVGQFNAAIKAQGKFRTVRTLRVQAGAARPTLVALERVGSP